MGAARARLSAPSPGARGRVLVVDDERAWRLILETDLSMLGYEVTLAADGGEALEAAARTKPEAAVIDMMLPEPLDGPTLARRLRRRGCGAGIVLYTAYSAVPTTADEPSVIGSISKGGDRSRLFDLVEQAVASARGRASGEPA